MSERGSGTKAVHGSGAPRSGPLTTPIVQSSTFVFESSAEMRRYLDGDEQLYLYTRYANPTLHELEAICEERWQLAQQKRLHHLLHGWLFVHVPLSAALLLLSVAHAVIALRY